MKQILLKTWLIVVCLLCGVGTTWAENTSAASYSRSGSSNTTSGGTFTNNLKTATGYLQDNSTSQDYYLQILNATAYWTTTPTSITFNANMGGGTGNKELTTPIKVDMLDKDGKVLSTTNVTSKITTAGGDNYSITITPVNNVAGFKLYHTKTANYNVRFYSAELVYVAGGSSTPATPYTVTFNAGDNGTCSTPSLTEASAGAGVTLPGVTANTNYTFVGWSTSATPTSADAGAAGDNYKPSSNCTLYAYYTYQAPSHDAKFFVNGQQYGETQSVAEGSAITFPTDPEEDGVVFKGWATAAIVGTQDDAPSFVNTATETMGTNDVTYYAVFAVQDGEPAAETKTQTLQYDTWTYSGTTTNKNGYRLFHSGSYIESASFDRSKLSKVIVYGGTFGGNSYNKLTIGDGTNTWKSVTVSGSSETGENTYTNGTALTGTGTIRVTSNSGSNSGSGSGVRISKVEIYTMEGGYTYSDYCTTVSLKAIPTLSFEKASYDATMGEDFTAPTLTNTEGVAVTYTSSETSVATVDSESGVVSLVGAGTTTIKASFAGNADYRSASASYELVVSPAKYVVTIETPENGTLAVTCDDVDVVSGNTYAVGKNIRIVATPADGYKFRNIQVVDNSTHTYTASNENVWTMGEHEISITANFDVIPTYTVAFSVNGVEVQSENLKEGAAVTVYADPEAINGKVFTGWIETSTVEDATPAYVTPITTATKNVTYYAVFATQTGEASLTTATLNAEGKSTTGYNKGTKDDSQGGTWNYNASVNNQSGTLYFGLNTNANNYNIASPVFEHNITKITLKAYNGSSTTDRKLLICSSNTTAQPSTGDLAEVTVKKSEAFTTTYEVDLSNAGNFSQFYIYAAAALGVSEVNVSYGSNPTYSNYTTLPDAHATITIASACTDGETCYSTYSNANAFVVPEGLTVSTVGIDSEGKLVVNSYNTGDIVAANTGVMVSGAAGDHDVTLTDAAATEAPGANNLHPSSEKMTGDNLFYRLTMHNGETIGFWWGAADGAAFNLTANKAYLAVPKSAGSNLRLWFGDETITGIDAIETADDSAIFNLQGQRIVYPERLSKGIQKGVNIVNGKKVLR